MTINWNRTIATAAVLLVSALSLNAQTPDTVFLEELTWVEVREMIDNGKTVVIIPTGGTEQNGPHMFLGKHNYIIRYTAEQMARRLGNALVAPVLQYVPEGDYNREGFGEKPGVITNPAPTFTKVLESAARSLQAHGFEDILIIGDSGGNQGGMEAAADNVNADWSGTGSRVFALRDYYAVGRDNYRAWMLAQFGYGPETVGGHAGISDTSQVLAVYPAGIRMEKRAPLGGSPDSGVSGDPTKATADIGRMGLEFKINAGLAQYRQMKSPPRGRGGRGGRGRGRGPGGY